MMKTHFAGFALLSILLVSAVASAQAPEPVDRLLATVRDETKDRAVRAQAISSLLAMEKGRGHDELAALLTSAETPEDLRLLIASGVLLNADLPLLDPVLDVAVGEDELGGKILDLFGDSPSGALVAALSARIGDEEGDPTRRLALIRLLGHTGRREALDRLIALWESEDAAVSDAAAASFQRILPGNFSGPAAARKFLEANPRLGVAELLKRHETQNGDTKPDPAVPALVELHRKVAGDVGYERLLEDFLRFADVAEIRQIGAEALAKYPWEEREPVGAKDARAKAAGVVLDVLDTEVDDDVVVALLSAARSLTESLLVASPERTNHVVTRHLESGSRAVRLAAVDTLGKLGDPRAIAALQAQFESAGEADADHRLAVLDALELIRTKQGLVNGGMSKWFIAKLEGGEKLDEVVLRLIKILGGYTELEGAVDPLANLLRTSENSQIRRMAANRLGLLGARPGDPKALAALAQAVVEDADPSVREVSATGLGRAPREKVAAGVIERLTTRLGKVETEDKVRTASAGSLLRLRGAEVLPSLMPLVADDDVWQQAILAWLNSEVLTVQPPEAAQKQTAAAAALVRALRGAGAWDRCEDAAGRIIDAAFLIWSGPAAAHRRSIVLDRAWAMAETGKPADALALLPAEEMPEAASDPDTFELIFLRARLLRLTGSSADAAPVLESLVAQTPPVEGADLRPVRLELAECRLVAEDWDGAVAVITALLEDPGYAERAAGIEERAKQGRQLGTLIGDLGSEEPEVRQAAVDGLKGMGEFAYAALDRWLTEREDDPAMAAVAVATIALILDQPLVYDPAATEEARQKALDAAHAALKPGA